MKKNLQFILVLSSLVFAASHSVVAQTTFSYPHGTFKKSGKPNYLTSPDDVIANTFLQRIQSSLPEYYPVPTYNPQYLAGHLTHDINLKDTADIWITFVDEGAGYTNTLTYYTYDLVNPPTVKPTNLNVIFPNLSLENNVLVRGNKVFLGRFPKGKGIGFALVANGFQNEKVTTGYNIFYSNPKFNPEPDTNKRRHSVLLMDSTQKIVLGFEDIRRDNASCDQDFNDAVFYVTAQSVGAAFGTFPITVGSIGTIGSGNQGGLESDGCLAGAIANRYFKRAKTPSVSYDNPELLESFKEVKKGSLQTRGDVELEQYIPENPLFEPTRAYLTTPKDLIAITNAKKVLSVDYFDAVTESRMAAVLSSKTESKVYDHTKTICDRLVGSTLVNIENIVIENMPFIRSTLLREDGTLEYAICFSVCKDDATSVTFVSRWGIDEYPTRPVFFNYQVWSQAPHISQKIVEEIIAKFRGQFANINTATESKLPTVYVKNGYYDNGFLTLNIHNPIQAKSLSINGNHTPTETGSRLPFNHKIVLTGEENETVKVYVGSVFDMGFALKADKSEAADALYFADGVWGLEYDKTVSKVDKFDVNNTIPTYEKGLYTLERDPILRGQVKDYVSMFRTLRPAATATDVTGFKNLSFTGAGTDVVDVILVKKSITDWAKQYRTEVRLNLEAKQFNVALTDFSNGSGEPIKADDITTIVFTVKGDGQNVRTFEMNLQNVAFDNKEVKKVALSNGIAVSPNPIEDVANVRFKMEERGSALITLSNVNGQTVMTKNEVFAKGDNDVKLDMTNYPSGIYILNVNSAKGTLKTKIIIP
jgi:Domain of unknown function (DUF4114)/Secretion system C-terminal sorting domain